MISFFSRNIFKICIIISIFLFYYLNSFSNLTKENISNQNNFNQNQSPIEEIYNEDNLEEDYLTNEEIIVESNDSSQFFNDEMLLDEKETKDVWKIEIPVIGLEAQIEEGTTKEILDNYVGHFEETSKKNGNVGLAAHNRGYKVNYFRNIKNLKEGDIINYYCDGVKHQYVVKIQTIIEDTDWSYLEPTDKNVITLITCVEDEPEYRRCVQAIEEGGMIIE